MRSSRDENPTTEEVYTTRNVSKPALTQVKEAEIVCRILSQLMRLIRLDPPALEAHAASLKVVCKDQSVNSPALAKAVICLYLQASKRSSNRLVYVLHVVAIIVVSGLAWFVF